MKSTILLSAMTVVALTLQGCSALGIGSKSKAVSATDANIVDPTGNVAGQQIAAAPAAPAKPASTANPAAPAASAKPAQAVTSEPTSPVDLKLEDAIAGRWAIIGVGSTVVHNDEDTPYVIFDPAEHRLYAYNGCNVLNGDYKVTGPGTVELGSMLSSLKYCAGIPYESAINATLAEGKPLSVKVEKIGHDSYLYFLDGKQVSMTCRRHNMEFLNGLWRVVSINGQEINDDEANVFFDIAELKIHGNTGCNFFNGTIYIDPARSNAIDFSNMGVTRMACPKTQQETAMLVALEQTTTAIQGSDDRAILLDAKGNQVLILKRMPVSAEGNAD